MMLAPKTIDDVPVRRLETQVRRCMSEGSMPPGNAEEIALVLWAQMRGHLSMRHEGAESRDRIRWLYDHSVEHALRAAA
jgi:hypothetical protein